MNASFLPSKGITVYAFLALNNVPQIKHFLANNSILFHNQMQLFGLSHWVYLQVKHFIHTSPHGVNFLRDFASFEQLCDGNEVIWHSLSKIYNVFMDLQYQERSPFLLEGGRPHLLHIFHNHSGRRGAVWFIKASLVLSCKILVTNWCHVGTWPHPNFIKCIKLLARMLEMSETRWHSPTYLVGMLMY